MLTKSRVDKANAKLAWLEDQRLTNNRIESIKNAIENINASICKRGNQERFSKGKAALDNQIIENLINDLNEEYKNIKNAFKSEEFEKMDIEPQEYLDYLDSKEEYATYSLQRHGLSSDQVQAIFNICKNKNLHKDIYEKVINSEIEKALKEGQINTGYRNVESPDKLAKAIRHRLYKYKKHEE